MGSAIYGLVTGAGALAAGLIIYAVATSGPPTAPVNSEPEVREKITGIKGPLNVIDVDSFVVAGTAVDLCGVRFTRNPSLKRMISENVRAQYNGKFVRCSAVNSRDNTTPCDGRAPTRVGKSIIAQCLIDGETDLAAELSAKGYLCDFPAHSGGVYTECKDR